MVWLRPITSILHHYLGDLENALNIYRPVFEQQRNFEHYTVVKRLATAVNPQRGEAFTAEVIAELQGHLPHRNPLIVSIL